MWFIYVLTCADNSYYCGITTNIDRRLSQHNAGTASKYTRARRPVSLAASAPVGSKSAALKAEIHIKKLPKKDKLSAINNKSWP